MKNYPVGKELINNNIPNESNASHFFFFFFFLGWGGGGEHSGSVVEIDSRSRGCRLEPHRCHCVVFLNRHINPCLVLVQPRKTHPDITEKLLTGT